MVTSRTDKLAQALWYIAPGQAEIRQETLAPVAQGEARVRAPSARSAEGLKRWYLPDVCRRASISACARR